MAGEEKGWDIHGQTGQGKLIKKGRKTDGENKRHESDEQHKANRSK